MASRFLLQIVDRQSGAVVQIEPGLAAEALLIVDCVKHITARGVGVFRTEAHVAQAVQQGIEQAILELKGQIKTP